MHGGAAEAYLKREIGNGATVDASDAGDGADAEAVAKGSNNFNLLFAGKDVHGADPC
jgi:hypothetical protein